MARLPRLNLPNIPQHVVQRGNNRQACFFDEQDYTVYLDKLKEYGKQYEVAVHAYVLMTNHVHLLLTPKAINGVRTLDLKTLDLHYRNHGAAFGQVLAAFKTTEADDEKLQQHLDELGFNCNFK